MQTPAFDFVVIYVSDLDAATDYFTNVLGFEHFVEGDGPGFRQMKGKGGIDFGLMLPNDARDKAGEIEIYVKTDDIQAMYAAISGKGIELAPIMDRPFGQIFLVPAPDGLKVVAMGDPVAVAA